MASNPSFSTARPSPDPSAPTHPADSPIEPARVRIPSLELDARVERLGVTKQGIMDVPSNVWDVGWLQTGVRPGGRGNAVIDGHHVVRVTLNDEVPRHARGRRVIAMRRELEEQRFAGFAGPGFFADALVTDAFAQVRHQLVVLVE